MNKGLYLHIPFCKSKCRYCSFNSFSGISFMQEEYKNALIKGIKNLNKDSLDTVYIGGGTPSVMKSEYIEEIMAAVFDRFDIDKNAEVTIEVNPATVDSKKVKAYKRAGINRVSMGVQSMVDDELKVIGRAHNSSDAVHSVYMVRNGGIDNISLDLMYALPYQTEESLMESIDGIISLQPNHISCYGLSIDEGTRMYTDLHKGIITKKDDEEYFSMYELIRKTLSDNGFVHYEISNFAKDGYQARHNTKYWKGREYYAMGAGASGYIAGERFVYPESVEEFINNPFEYNVEEELFEDDKMSEFVILGLRLLRDGVNKKEFLNLFKKDIYDVFGYVINKHIRNGMLKDDGEKILLTPSAYYVSNVIMSDFMDI